MYTLNSNLFTLLVSADGRALFCPFSLVLEIIEMGKFAKGVTE
jgi:hypothetical protein